MYKNFKIYKIFTAKHLEMYTACTSTKKINTQCLIYTKKISRLYENISVRYTVESSDFYFIFFFGI